MDKDSVLNQQIKEHQQYKQLTASELADLFNNYLGDTMFGCIFEYSLQVVEDDEIKDYIEFALDLSKKHLMKIKDIFTLEKIPIPVGFGEQDIHKDAPRLFSDLFMAFYIYEMARASLLIYGSAFAASTRQDIMNYFRNCINDSAETLERGTHLLLSKGMEIGAPPIPYPNKIDFVKKKSFISIITGRDRPLTGAEIKQLQMNITTNILGKALMLSFGQVASSEKIRKYFMEGSQLANTLVKSFADHLLSDNLPAPKIMDAHITDSSSPPFSDKLMLYHGTLAGNIAIQNFGVSLSQMLRHDLEAEFIKFIPLIGKYCNDGLNMMIEQGWLEEPFKAADREERSQRHPE